MTVPTATVIKNSPVSHIITAAAQNITPVSANLPFSTHPQTVLPPEPRQELPALMTPLPNTMPALV